jgi:hypothetical protein
MIKEEWKTEKDFIKMSLEKATSLPDDGLFNVFKNRYWVVIEGNILFYRSYCSPQCNSNVRIMDNTALVCKYGASIKLIERVFVPHNCSDYI